MNPLILLLKTFPYRFYLDMELRGGNRNELKKGTRAGTQEPSSSCLA